MSLVGFTTSIPIEVLYASGHTGVDLNNIFITHREPASLIELAEKRGLPVTLCSWIKGIYAVLQQRPDINTIIAVVSGDCSNALPLADLLESEGREVIPFAYPYDRDKEALTYEIGKLAKRFNTSYEDMKEASRILDVIRRKADEIDLLTWSDGKVSGFENHYYLVNTSDFKGSPEEYSKELDLFLGEAVKREVDKDFLPLAFVGVPPIFSDIYEFLESRKARVVYNETQRQFTLPNRSSDIVERYLEYTYPYSLLHRIEDIRTNVALRGVKGIIHYTQSFCHHQMDHILLKENIGLPLLMLEGDRPVNLDERTKLRIESFLEMIA